MRIVFLTSSLTAGGAERVATILCNAWAARGDSVSLVPTYSGGGEPFYPVSDAVETVFLANEAGQGRGRLAGYPARLRALRRMIRSRQPDVVVSFLPNVNVAAILAMAHTGIPLIISERNDPSSRSPLNGWELASMLTFRFASMLTVQTEAVAGKASARYPGLRKVRVVPNPLPASALATPPAAPAARADGRKVLLSLGRLTAQKGIDRVIDAFARLASRFPQWDLHIYGDGPLRESLAALAAAHGLSRRIAFMGLTSEPARVMASADAFVMGSRHEGFPNALLEAMSAGLPCLATDCPSGPREISRDGADALLVPLDDAQAYTDALARLMDDASLRAALGRRASVSIRERYSLDSVLARWDELFAEVVRRPEGRAAPSQVRPAGQPLNRSL